MDYTGWLKVIKVLKSGEEKEGEREDFLKVSFYKDLFIFIFWLWWIFIAVSGLSLVALCRFPFEVSCLVAEHELECRLSSCCTWALLLQNMWDLPRPGIKPISPALAGGFLTIEPPRKSYILVLM